MSATPIKLIQGALLFVRDNAMVIVWRCGDGIVRADVRGCWTSAEIDDAFMSYNMSEHFSEAEK